MTNAQIVRKIFHYLSDGLEYWITNREEPEYLSQAGIASINLTSTATNTTLAGGNVLTAKGTYTKTNGQTGEIGEFETSGETTDENGNTGNLDLANNPFYRQFTDAIPLSEAAAALPDLHGAGMARDLREAATLNAAWWPTSRVSKDSAAAK
ncbi:MAG: hypothetical protein LBE81_01575 [Azonexus sp.]|nr:hypothetical protein [Azonexus sp.]